MQTFSVEELARYDGKEGRPVYIAHDGKVYDVSESRMWKGGRHMKRHDAGTDLTTAIQAAPHASDVLARYPQVGILEEEPPSSRAIPPKIAWLLNANPFFRRHPHPMTVHFPIVFLLSAPFFHCLCWVTGNRSFDTTAFHCLGGGVLFLLVAMVTGYFTWWYNYMARLMKPVVIKIPLSIITLFVAGTLFVWRWRVPDVLVGPQGLDGRYLLCSLTLIPLIAIIGWYGATMTFPLEK